MRLLILCATLVVYALPVQAQEQITYSESEVRDVEEAGWGTIASDGTLVPMRLFTSWGESFAERLKEDVPEHCARWVGSWSGGIIEEDGDLVRTKRITITDINTDGSESCYGRAIVGASYLHGRNWGTVPGTTTHGPWWRDLAFVTDGKFLEFTNYPPRDATFEYEMMDGYIEQREVLTGSYNSMGGGLRTWSYRSTAHLYDKPLVPHDASISASE